MDFVVLVCHWVIAVKKVNHLIHRGAGCDHTERFATASSVFPRYIFFFVKTSKVVVDLFLLLKANCDY